MARRRMVSLDIIDTDKFIEMPTSSQCLYFHLLSRADDDGFVDSPKKIIKMVNCSDDDLKLLILKQFIIPFDSGVCVIKDWRIHNYIQSDRYKETLYTTEKSQLNLEENNMYTLCVHDGDTGKVNIELGKNSIKNAKEKQVKHKYGEYKNVLLTDDEFNKLKNKYSNYDELIKNLDEGIELKGYKYNSHYLAILKWNNKNKNIEPVWLNKKNEKKECSAEEQGELDNLLKEFK